MARRYKFLSTKKVWRGFTSTFQRRFRFRFIKTPKVIGKTTQRFINTTLSTLLRNSNRRHARELFPSNNQKLLSGKKNLPRSTLRRRGCQIQKRSSISLTDNRHLSEASTTVPPIESPESREVIKHTFLATGFFEKDERQEELPNSFYDTSESSFPVTKLEGVDKRAEEFIANFHKEIRLQRQRSISEFQEMLARGAL